MLFTALFGLFFLFSTAVQPQSQKVIAEFLDGDDRKITVPFDPVQKCVLKISYFNIRDSKFSIQYRKTLDLRYIDPKNVSVVLDQENDNYNLTWVFHDASADQSGKHSLEKGFRAFDMILEPLWEAAKQLEGDDKIAAKNLSYRRMFDENKTGAFGKIFQNNYIESFVLLGMERYRFIPMVNFLTTIKVENFYSFHRMLIDHNNANCSAE